MNTSDKAKVVFGSIALLGALAVSIQSGSENFVALLGVVGLVAIVLGLAK